MTRANEATAMCAYLSLLGRKSSKKVWRGSANSSRDMLQVKPSPKSRLAFSNMILLAMTLAWSSSKRPS